MPNMKPLINEEPFQDFDSLRTLKIKTDGNTVELQAEFDDDEFVTIESFTSNAVKKIHLHNGQRYRVLLPSASTKAWLSQN